MSRGGASHPLFFFTRMLLHGLARRIIVLAALSGGAVVLLQGAPTPSPIRFELSKIPFRLDNDQTPAKNAPEAMHGRVAVFDYNADGRPDIFFFTNGGSGSDMGVAARTRKRHPACNVQACPTELRARSVPTRSRFLRGNQDKSPSR